MRLALRRFGFLLAIAMLLSTSWSGYGQAWRLTEGPLAKIEKKREVITVLGRSGGLYLLSSELGSKKKPNKWFIEIFDEETMQSRGSVALDVSPKLNTTWIYRDALIYDNTGYIVAEVRDVATKMSTLYGIRLVIDSSVSQTGVEEIGRTMYDAAENSEGFIIRKSTKDGGLVVGFKDSTLQPKLKFYNMTLELQLDEQPETNAGTDDEMIELYAISKNNAFMLTRRPFGKKNPVKGKEKYSYALTEVGVLGTDERRVYDLGGTDIYIQDSKLTIDRDKRWITVVQLYGARTSSETQGVQVKQCDLETGDQRQFIKYAFSAKEKEMFSSVKQTRTTRELRNFQLGSLKWSSEGSLFIVAEYQNLEARTQDKGRESGLVKLFGGGKNQYLQQHDELMVMRFEREGTGTGSTIMNELPKETYRGIVKAEDGMATWQGYAFLKKTNNDALFLYIDHMDNESKINHTDYTPFDGNLKKGQLMGTQITLGGNVVRTPIKKLKDLKMLPLVGQSLVEELQNTVWMVCQKGNKVQVLKLQAE